MKVMIVLRSSAMDMYVDSVLRSALDRGHDVDILYSEDSLIKAVSHEACSGKAYITERSDLDQGQLPFVSRLSILLRRLINYGLFVCRGEQSYHYVVRYEGQLPPIVRNSKTIRILIALPYVINLLIKVDKYIKPSPEVYRRVKHCGPDVLLTAPHNKTPALETEFVKVANRMSIPSAILPLSWDNLTTKGLINVTPTSFLVWNQSQFEIANKYPFVHRSIISIVGAPVFDRWFDFQEKTISKKMADNFLHDVVGIPRGKRFILYLGSAINITGDESWLINELATELAGHPDLHDVFILFRPHPANYGFADGINLLNCFVYPRSGALPSDVKSREEMFISFKSAICTVGVNTSGLLDAVINDAITIAICHSAYHSTQNQTLHFKELLNFGCMDQVSNVRDLPEKIRGIGDLRDPLAAKRREFIETFVRPRGLTKSAGEEVVVSLEKLV